MPSSPLRLFYTKLNRAKEQLAKGNLQACLMNLAEAIRLKLHHNFLKRDLTTMEEDLLNFGYKLTSHKLYKEEFGPVAIVPGREEEWLGFLDQLMVVEEEGTFGKLKQGQDMLDSGNLELARHIFGEVMEDNKTDAGVALDVGDRYMDKGLWRDAENAYRRAMAIDSETLHILNRLAMSLRKEGKLDSALEIYKRALKINPEDEGLYYNTARVVHQKSRPDLAIKLLKTALTKNPAFEAGQKYLHHLEAELKKQPADQPDTASLSPSE